MRPCRAVPLIAFMLLALASPAAADSYLSVGIGQQADTEGALDGSLDRTPGQSGRVALGQRLGPLAVEAGLCGTDLPDSGARAALVSATAELKYHIDLPAGLELYGKGGLSHGWVGVDGRGVVDEGSGYTLGGGVQLRISPGPLGSAAIWLDYTHHEIELDSGASSTLAMANLGLSVGL